MQGARRVACHKAQLIPKLLSQKVQRNKILKHFMAMRAAFQPAYQVSVAFDTSRIGGLQRLFGAVCNGQLACWLPPQVPSTEHSENPYQ